jgi:8-amino-7-oxononanoate synthase
LANLAVASSLVNRDGIIIEDKLDHASLIDAARLSQARLNRYRHADPNDAERLLKKHHLKSKLVLTDGVFSMDGDFAPLMTLAKLCQKYNAMLMVDDAHGFGVLGKKGGGILEHLGLDSDEVPVLMGTFGKSLGAMGAFVAGDSALIEVLIQKARSYIYTTALPPAVAATVTRALGLVEHEVWRRDHLVNLINQFRLGCQQLGLKISTSETAIQPLVIGDPKEAVQVSERWYRKGILIPAIRPPTVPPATSRLRISLSAAHDGSQIDYLLESLGAVL